MLKIGKLATQAGVSVDTIRFYERRGLLPKPERLPSGYRVYEHSAVNRILMTKSLQALGFTLDEIALNLKDIDAGELSRATGDARMRAVLIRVEQRIEELESVRNQIHTTLAACQAGDCPFNSDRRTN